MRRLFAIIVAAFALAGCSMEDITIAPKCDIYYASFEDFGEESRTYVDENVKLLWHEDDRISLFRTTLNEQFKFTGATGDNSGGFALIESDEWVTGNVVSTNYAVYPYDATTKLSNDEIIQLTMPAVQHYAENSFGRGANTMVAASENTSSKFLPFRNLGGYIIVKLYGEDTTIKSIEFKGNNEEVIAGAATAEAKYGYLPVIAMSESGTTTITLDCGEEGVIISSDSANPTSFWFVVPPITFEGGFTFTITDINGNTFTKSTTKSQTVVRNEVKSMSGFEPTFEGEGEDPEVATKPANNEIWYTNGSTTKATTPYETDGFGVNIVSNTYDAEKECWVIKFDGDVTKINYRAFYCCSSLTSVTIPDSVTTIGSLAFYRCSSLTSVNIPDSVTTIGYGAFYNCSSLTSVTIPDGVTTIGDSPFVSCSMLQEFKGKFASDDGRCLIQDGRLIAFAPAGLTEYAIPDSATTIGDEAFKYCSSLTSVNIPDSVTTIGGSAFYNCSSLMSITIPKNITKIERYTFRYCTSLTSITIPDSVTIIGDQAFSGCLSLKSVDIGSRVTTINYRAFEDCASLTSITIPDNVKEIYQAAFDGCKSLSEVIIGKGLTYLYSSQFTNISNDSVLTINSNIPNSFELEELDNVGCFEGSSFKYVVIENGVTNVGDRAFQNCPNLTSVKFNDANVEISEKGFEGCSQLSRVEFGTALKSIGPNAFANCVRLTHVSIPDSTTSCGPYAFYGCEKLSNIILGENITDIGGSAFRGCTSLTDIVIPKNVKNIYDYAFADCPNLQVVECEPIEPPTLYGPNVFANNHLSRVIYVNETCLSDYRAADYWNQYYSFIIY